MNRRGLLAAAALVLPLPFIAACGLLPPPAASTPLDQAKVYADDLANAIAAAAATYLVGTPKPSSAQAILVNHIVTDLQAAKTALNSITVSTDAKSVALQLVAAAQQLAPIVGVFLGPAAPYVPLAIAVVNAFIASLPAPPNAPPTPPAALRRMAARYHPH